MLSKPEWGWSWFTLGRTRVQISNVFTPLPCGWLKEAIRGLEKNQPFVVYGWCEPEYIFCTVTKNFCYLAYTDDFSFSQPVDFVSISYVSVTMKDFCQMLHDDISKNIDAWVDWTYNPYPDNELTEQEIIAKKLKIKNELQHLLKKLNLLITT